MTTYEYAGQPNGFKLEAIMDDLIAALGVVPYVEGATDGSSVRISVPDGVAQAAVDAVIAAHDPSLPSLAEIADAQARAVEAALKQTDAPSIQQALLDAKDVDTLREATLALSDIVINLLAVAKARS